MKLYLWVQVNDGKNQSWISIHSENAHILRSDKVKRAELRYYNYANGRVECKKLNASRIRNKVCNVLSPALFCECGGYEMDPTAHA